MSVKCAGGVEGHATLHRVSRPAMSEAMNVIAELESGDGHTLKYYVPGSRGSRYRVRPRTL